MIKIVAVLVLLTIVPSEALLKSFLLNHAIKRLPSQLSRLISEKNDLYSSAISKKPGLPGLPGISPMSEIPSSNPVVGNKPSNFGGGSQIRPIFQPSEKPSIKPVIEDKPSRPGGGSSIRPIIQSTEKPPKLVTAGKPSNPIRPIFQSPEKPTKPPISIRPVFQPSKKPVTEEKPSSSGGSTPIRPIFQSAIPYYFLPVTYYSIEKDNNNYGSLVTYSHPETEYFYSSNSL